MIRSKLIVLASLILLSADVVSAQPVEYLGCNGPAIQFDNPGYGFSINDLAGSGVRWGNLSDCGLAGNFTQGSGNALCVRSGPNVAAGYDTTWESNEFTLVGADTATLQFSVNYQDLNAVAGNDRLDVDVWANGGPWVTVQVFQSSDRGVENVIGGGQPIFVNLNAQTGGDKVKVRFHYYDPNAAPDSGIYAMIDNVTLTCTGGADIQTSVSLSKTEILEGQDLSYTVNFRNNGPKTANDLVGITTVPNGFSVLSASSTQGVFLPGGSTFGPASLGAQIGVVGSGQAPSMTVTAKAGMVPEVLFDIQSPLAVAGNYEAAGAVFGPAIQPGQTISGTVAIADDGVSPTSDACQPLINQGAVAGKIVLVERGSSGCEDDERVKHVQDAGGALAVVARELTPIPAPYSTSSFFLKYLYTFSAMRPSGKVGVPITIPSVLVSHETGVILKNNLVNAVSVAMTGVPVLAQQQEVGAVALAKEFDDDFPDGLIGLLIVDGSNNLSSGTVTVLKDSDRDLVPDLNEECDLDPLKTTPGSCGCGAVDLDSDGNGIADCRSGDELKYTIIKAKGLIGKLKSVPTNLSPKKSKARKAALARIRSDAKAALSRISEIVKNPITGITMLGTANLDALTRKALTQGARAIKTQGNALSGRKKKALAAITKLLNSLA